MWVHLSPKSEHARNLNRIKFYIAVHGGISGYVSINSIGERATVILVYTYTYHHVGTLITMWVHLSPCGYTYHQNQNTPEALIELSSIELYMRGFRVMSQTIVSGREPPSYWCTLTIITMWVHLSPKPEHARSLNRIKFYRAVHAGISGYVSINSIGERATVILVYTYTYHHVGTLITKTRTRQKP